MVKAQAGKWVVPNPQIPRSFGLMNIIFGAVLLLTAIGYGVFYFYAPAIQGYFSLPMKQIQEKQKTDRAAKIADLKAAEKAAKTEAEKQTLADERAAIEGKVELDMSSFDDLQKMNAYNVPTLAIFEIFDISTAVVLNVLMIVAGGGLMALAEWARRLSIWVARLKILRWLLMIAANMIFIIPMMLERTEKAMAAFELQIKASGTGAPPFSLIALTRWSVIFGSLVLVFTAIVSSVYPAMLLWYLSRPAARAACLKKPPELDLAEPNPQ